MLPLRHLEEIPKCALYMLYRVVTFLLEPFVENFVRLDILLNGRLTNFWKNRTALNYSNEFNNLVWKQRLGLTEEMRRAEELKLPVLWFHAASIGETLSIFPLIYKYLEEFPK